MRRLHTTFDLLEGHALANVLREHGIEAELFDADFVRQNWFQMLAFGGYRVMVADDTWNAARELLAQYKNGELSVAEDLCACPRCGHAAAHDDPQPRRNVFLAMIVLPVVEFFALPYLNLTHTRLLAAFFVQFLLYATIPLLLMRYFKWRLRCADCGHRWRELPQCYAALRRQVDAAENPPA